jgi:iron(III) transport system substrate-binding protein
VEGAKKETNLVVWITTPNLEPTQRAAIAAFKQRFGLSQLNVEWLPIHQNDANTRIVAEAKGGRHTVDVVSGSLGNMAPVVEAGLMAKVDWNGIFGQELPGVKEAAGGMIDDWAGLGLAHWDIVYVMNYNTDQMKPAEAPNDVESLADPKWKGRFALNTAGAAPFDTMALEWGKEKTLELLKQIYANGPVLKNGTPSVIVAIGQGEVPVGVGQITGTQTETAKGAPIAWKPMTYLPLLQQFLYVPKTAPSPNAARLFTAWATTEGMKIQEEMEYIGRASDPNSFIAKEVQKVAPGAKIVRASSLKDATFLVDVRADISKILTGGG